MIDDAELKQALAAERPYGEWLLSTLVASRAAGPPHVHEPDHETVLQRSRFRYTHEDLRILLSPMARTGQEPVGSMGTDTSLALLSSRPRCSTTTSSSSSPRSPIRPWSHQGGAGDSMESTVGPERNLCKPSRRAATRL